MAEKEIITIELNEESIESMVYEIRGQKVMLDYDLARIYGYTTKRFNEQVKRNIEKFPEDFMFQLTEAELRHLVRSQFATTEKSMNESENIVRSKKSTTELWAAGKGGRAYLPYAFTEQGVYMLMTVLRGELAIKQSKALIRLFKKMKDYIIESNGLMGYNASLINNKFSSYDKRFEKVEEKLEIVMDNFIDPSTYKHFLILNGDKLEADVAYQTIYSLAKFTIHIIDDYIGLKTLHLLSSAKEGVKIIIYSDNVSRNPLKPEYIEDFIKQSGIDLVVYPSNNKFHSRYIFIDYGTDNEKIYLCGPSSKDAGNKIDTIISVEGKEMYDSLNVLEHL